MNMSDGHSLGFVAAGYGALFTMGLAGSLHCLSMCGPISCLLGASKGRGVIAYHLARLLSYTALGAMLWKLEMPLRLSLTWPWLLVLVSLPLLIYAFMDLEAVPPVLGRLYVKTFWVLQGLPPWQRGLGLGLLTPLLPCGLFYAAIGFSVAAPSALTASGWMLSFAAGTLPLLIAGQVGWNLAGAIRNPRLLSVLRRSVAGLAAVMVILFALMDHY